MRSGPAFLLRRFGWLAPVFVLVSLWIPVWSHYHVPGVALSPETVERARSTPSDSVLAELEGARFSGRRWSDQPGLVLTADRLLNGVLAIPGYPETPVKIPFDEKELEEGLPGWQLELASLVVPEILLQAYESTGRPRYFDAARDVILAWAAYERRSVVPRGFLYNDHAIVNRSVVLGHFWHLYRRHPSYDPTVARGVLEFAVRGAHPLAHPEHYTVATNHGVMQNLGLWHLTIAFPWMPGRDRIRDLAFRRLDGQMGFYVDSQGVVLEHSAEYQAFGVELLGMALRYRTLMEEAIPPSWLGKYEASVEVYERMRRPDGSLPALGDTESRPEPHIPLVTSIDPDGRATPLVAGHWIAPTGAILYPHAGYAIWWDRPDALPENSSQTITAWSYFPGHGHKHADEPSVLLWARGSTWWTNVGYWQYGVPGRDEALSWAGSNAPHLVEEPATSDRVTRALGYGGQDGLTVLDLEREGPGPFRVRRQVLHASPSFWIVLDHTDGVDGDRVSTVWTASPDVNVRPGPGTDTYRLVPPAAPFELRAGFVTSGTGEIDSFRGSNQPFAGWAVHHGTPTPTTSIVIDRPAPKSWAATAWLLAPRSDALPSGSLRDEASVVRVDSKTPENWTITLAPWLGGGTVRRDGPRVTVTDARGSVVGAVTLSAVRANPAEASSVRESFRNQAARYPRYRDHVEQRTTVSLFVVVAAVLLEIAFFIWMRVRAAGEIPLRAAAVLAWIAAAIWFSRVYFS